VIFEDIGGGKNDILEFSVSLSENLVVVGGAKYAERTLNYIRLLYLRNEGNKRKKPFFGKSSDIQ